MNMDQLLEKKVKKGLYQTLVFFRVCYLDLFYGIDVTFTCIMIQILRKEFNLTFPYYTNISSIFLIGVIVGNFICAYFTFVGRKNMIMGFSLLAFLSQISISFSQYYNQIIFLRFLLGLALGSATPLPYTILAEIIEVRFKARFVYCLNFAYLTGKFYVIFLCFIFLKNFDEGNWRGLMLLSSLPLLISFISTITLKETSAFLLHKEMFIEAFEQINQECLQNNQTDLSLEEQEDIKQWILYQNENVKKSKNGIFSYKYAVKTIQLWSILVICNNQIIAIHLLVPLLLAQSNQTFRELLMIASFEAISIFIIYQTLDFRFWGGRRVVLLVTSSLTIIMNAYMYFYREDSIILGSMITQIVARNTLATTLVLTSLSYDTSIRTQGLGIAQGVGKIASIFCAPTFIYLNGIDPYLPFLYLGLLAVLQLFIVWTFNEN
ncbi:hypothetical protein pb186bvf_020410 [Paramecium bursaria]